MITRLAIAALALAQGDGAPLKYRTKAAEKDRIYAETRLGISIQGSDALANFVRTMHPLLSLEKLVIRAEGTHAILGPKKHKIEYEEARIEARYDDEDMEFDYQKGFPPEGLDKDKAKQMMWFLAAAGRSFSLSESGEYRSDDPNQDHNGEAMDLIALGVVRLPAGAPKEGETWERSWKGERAEKNKSGRFGFKQRLRVEKIEEKDGKRLVTIAGELSGKLEGAGKEPGAEENWTKCEGTSKTVLEAGSGRIVSAQGAGKVATYFRNASDTGAKQELTLTFSVEGKLQAK